MVDKETDNQSVSTAALIRAVNELFQKLRRVRERLAAKEFVPAYIVFSDATLREMSVKCPATPDQLLAVSGVGKYKLEKYGDVFLQTIAEYMHDAAAVQNS